jgi:crotonobetainyl-CoA:carnitine CoA-transferase CaiB-like acyl-CoA transferase
VTVSLTPYGGEGPKADWAGTDLTVLAAGGQLVLNGDADRPPVRISLPQAWLHTALEGAIGALIALHERATSGHGQHVDVSAQQCVLQCTQTAMIAAAIGAPEYGRVAGGIKVGPYTLRLVYPAADGHVSITFLFGSMVGPFTQRLMRWVHESGFCDEAARDLNYIEFFDLIFTGALAPETLQRATDAVAAFTATKTKAELLAGAMERRLLIAPVTTTADVVASEQLAARDAWDDVEGIRCPGPFARASATPLRRLGRPPHLDEHGTMLRSALPRVESTSIRSEEPAGTERRALDGLKVLDLSWAIAAPMVTRVLADHGATVVRVESQHRLDAIRGAGPYLAGTAGGIEDTTQWHSVNAGKLSLQLNLATEGARDVVRDLVRWADVLVESFSPKAMRAWGLDYEALRPLNPGLVMLSSCLMGQTGPLAQFAGFGNLAGAITGFYQITGWPDRAPAGPFLAYTDYTSPRMSLPLLLAAIDHRRRTGEGQYLDFSQAEASAHFLAPALIEYTMHGRIFDRRGNDDDVMAPHGVYPVRGDDRWVAIACRDDADWRALCELMGRPDLATVGASERRERRRSIDETVAGWTEGQDAEAVQDELQRRGVPAHQVQNSRECVADPQLEYRRHFRRVPHPTNGTTVVEGPHFTLSRTPPDVRWGGPTLGQHTDEVLGGLLGYDGDRIADLVVAGALE